MTKVLLLGVAALLEPSPVTVLDEMIGEGLITMESVEIIKYTHGKKKSESS